MFPDDYKDIDFSAVQSQVHKLALRALIETELRPCEINRRLGITDKTLLYRLGWKHFGKSFFTDRTSCLSRRAQERALGEIKARAESEKAGPGERCSDSDPVVIVPAPAAGPAAAPRRPAAEPCAAERAIDTGGLGIADVVVEGRHTPWFERHVPASRRADLRPHLPWLGSCNLMEPLSPAQLAAIELFLYTDFVTADLRALSPALAGSFTGPVAQCLSLGTATPPRLVKRRWNAIDRLRHQGAAQALPQPAAHATAAIPATPATAATTSMPAASAGSAAPPGFRLVIKARCGEIEYEGRAPDPASLEILLRLAMGGAA